MLKIVGHRGAGGLAPENTLAAIRKAVEHHVDEIEIDVRVTKDQTVILHHDKQVHDQTGAAYAINSHTLQELIAHKPDLTTLPQAIEALDRAVPLQIEVKGGEPVQPIIKVLEVYLEKGWQAEDFLLGSKSQKTLRSLHQALPDIPTVVIEPWSSVRAHWRVRQLGTTANRRISMRGTWLWSGFIRASHRGGYQLYAYTLNDPAKAKRWAKHGLTGVITDRPDLYDDVPSHNDSDNR